MNIWSFRLTRFSKIFFDKRLGRVFVLKYLAEFLKHLAGQFFEALREN